MNSETKISPAGQILPLVSVVMNCYNGEAYLRDALRSVVAQTYGNWELIFWDNASTDATRSIVESFADKRIRYFFAAEKIPLGGSRNAALGKARGDFIAFLDTDDIWHPAKLYLQVELLTARPEVAFVYSNFRPFFGKNLPDLERCKGKYILPQPTGDVFGKFLRQSPVNLQTVMIRRSALEGGSLFDPILHLSEEYDLFMRVLYRNRAAYISKVLAGYRLHDKQDSMTKYELYPIEAEYILEKFRRMIPQSFSEFAADYAYFDAKIAYYHARVAMRKGNAGLARQLIRPHVFKGGRFLAVYLLLLLPREIFALAHKWSGRYH